MTGWAKKLLLLEFLLLLHLLIFYFLFFGYVLHLLIARNPLGAFAHLDKNPDRIKTILSGAWRHWRVGILSSKISNNFRILGVWMILFHTRRKEKKKRKRKRKLRGAATIALALKITILVVVIDTTLHDTLSLQWKFISRLLYLFGRR